MSQRTWRREWSVVALCAAVGACGQHEAPDDELHPARASDAPQLVSAEEALSGAHIPTIDPATMNDAEVRKALGAQPFCAFSYVSDGNPVLALSAAQAGRASQAVVKLNGRLVALESLSDTPREAAFGAGNVTLSVSARSDAALGRGSEQQADLVLTVGEQLKVGYGGYFACAEAPPSAAIPQH